MASRAEALSTRDPLAVTSPCPDRPTDRPRERPLGCDAEGAYDDEMDFMKIYHPSSNATETGALAPSVGSSALQRFRRACLVNHYDAISWALHALSRLYHSNPQQFNHSKKKEKTLFIPEEVMHRFKSGGDCDHRF